MGSLRLNPLGSPVRHAVREGDSSRAFDAAMLEKVRSGEAAALGALLKVWWRPLVRYCQRILQNVDSAEDVAQEAFIRLWEHRSRWRPKSSARAILYTIARNIALDQRESIAARILRLSKDPGRMARVPSPHERVEAGEFQVALERAISRLPAHLREVILLSRLDGLSRAEIVEITGLSPQTVANYLVLALKNLRTVLNPFFRDR